jgi:GDP-L-fucose synthase
MKKILILGSGGFIGSNLMKSFTLDQFDVHQIKGKTDLDIRNEKLFQDYITDLKPEVVINCAANVGGIDYSRGKEIELINDNFKIGLSVLEGMRRLSNSTLITPIPNCVYPGHLSFYKLQDLWKGEVHESVKSYGVVKRVYIDISRIYSESSNFDYCNLIFPNIYGPGDHLDEKRAHALGALIYKSLVAKQDSVPFMEIWGSGKPIREWLFINDAVEFIKQAILLGLKDKNINCGSGQTISIRELAVLINKFTMFAGELRFDLDKRDGALIKKMDSELSEELLGYRAKYPLEDGIRETVKWYARELVGGSNGNL